MVRRGTYSIVARDEATGTMGAAVQSHWFSVGSLVTWAQAGVGAAVTQSVVEVAYGPWLLGALAAGRAADDALGEILEEDPQAGFRQVAAIGTTGPPAVHTGADCIAFAGHQRGDCFSVQANMMASEAVWGAIDEHGSWQEDARVEEPFQRFGRPFAAPSIPRVVRRYDSGQCVDNLRRGRRRPHGAQCPEGGWADVYGHEARTGGPERGDKAAENGR